MASIVLKLFERISYLLRAAFRRRFTAWRCVDCAPAPLALQATGSTIGSKEPNILANYLRAQAGFLDSPHFSRDSGRFPRRFGAVSARFGRSWLCRSTYSVGAPMLIK
ncbi:hypothetical protein [Paraburkholderia bryophila]|uniref:Uncharacterized protein n=1 Tax=Paraburkholderia bryophila TaxID=420952 RepID=A0A7Z0B4T2_9BURK|nr:hypothetical protein [Paraburkholderia bryophila]NYH21229.1 hypothetical protein [Paraburkholderia bryophila]